MFQEKFPFDGSPESTFVLDELLIGSKRKPYKNLVLSGGSVRCIAQIGAVQSLIDNSLLNFDDIEAIAGSSGGALYGCLIAVGYTNLEIRDILFNLNMSKLINPNPLFLLESCGMETGEILYNFIEDLLHKKTGMKKITFSQLYELRKKQLIVVGSCLTTKEVVYFDHKRNPTMEIAFAIRISVSIPGFFVPVILDGNTYIDGSVLKDYPMSVFRDQLEDTIGIQICKDYDTKYQFLDEYFCAIINLCLDHYVKETCSTYEDNTVQVSGDFNSISIFDFNLDLQVKQKLYEIGVSSATNFIRDRI